MKRWLALSITLTTLLTPSFIYAESEQAEFKQADRGTYVAIIIDDIGHSLRDGRRALLLPGHLTYSILPFGRHSTRLARQARKQGKEVMLHVPMQNISERHMEADVLTDSLSRAEFARELDILLGQIPDVRGVNNHMGSFLTQQAKPMGWFLEEIKRRQLYFIDSRTTPKTVALSIAIQKHILTGSRDVFLDNERSTYAIDLAFQRLIRIAKRKGTAIAIGHPHAATIRYLDMALPLLELHDIKLIPASILIALQTIKRNNAASVDNFDVHASE